MAEILSETLLEAWSETSAGGDFERTDALGAVTASESSVGAGNGGIDERWDRLSIASDFGVLAAVDALSVVLVDFVDLVDGDFDLLDEAFLGTSSAGDLARSLFLSAAGGDGSGSLGAGTSGGGKSAAVGEALVVGGKPAALSSSAL